MLSVEGDAEDVEHTKLIIGDNYDVLGANAEVLRIDHASFVIL